MDHSQSAIFLLAQFMNPLISGMGHLGQSLLLRAAELLIKIKDECYASKRLFSLVTTGVDDLINIFIEIITVIFRKIFCIASIVL